MLFRSSLVSGTPYSTTAGWSSLVNGTPYSTAAGWSSLVIGTPYSTTTEWLSLVNGTPYSTTAGWSSLVNGTSYRTAAGWLSLVNGTDTSSIWTYQDTGLCEHVGTYLFLHLRAHVSPLLLCPQTKCPAFLRIDESG